MIKFSSSVLKAIRSIICLFVLKWLSGMQIIMSTWRHCNSSYFLLGTCQFYDPRFVSVIWQHYGKWISWKEQIFCWFCLHLHSNLICEPVFFNLNHYNDVIMSAMASQITSIAIVYSTVIYSGADQRKLQSSSSLARVRGIHRSQRASNAEKVSIWLRQRFYRWSLGMDK